MKCIHFTGNFSSILFILASKVFCRAGPTPQLLQHSHTNKIVCRPITSICCTLLFQYSIQTLRGKFFLIQCIKTSLYIRVRYRLSQRFRIVGSSALLFCSKEYCTYTVHSAELFISSVAPDPLRISGTGGGGPPAPFLMVCKITSGLLSQLQGH